MGLIPVRQRIELCVKFQCVLVLLAPAWWCLSEFIPFEGGLTFHCVHMPHRLTCSILLGAGVVSTFWLI